MPKAKSSVSSRLRSYVSKYKSQLNAKKKNVSHKFKKPKIKSDKQ